MILNAPVLLTHVLLPLFFNEAWRTLFTNMSNFVHIQDGSADALMENDYGKRHIDMQLLWYININEETFIRKKKKKEDNSKDKQ